MSRKDVDLSLEEAILKKFVFTNAAKLWNRYVTKLIQYSIEKIFSKMITRNKMSVYYLPYNKSLKICIQLLMEEIKDFLFKSKKVNVCHVDLYLLWSKNYIIREIHETILFKSLMTYRPSFLQMNWFPDNNIDDVQVKQHFILNPNFYLHISFYYIYFSSSSFLKCFFGNLMIQNIAHKYGSNFKYCGIIPSFKIYSMFEKVTIAITIESYEVAFDTIISYSVIDAYKIISYNVKITKTEVPVTVIKPLSTESYLLKYHFKVERYETMDLLCNFSQYHIIDVYDGPGTLYNILQPLAANDQMVLYTSTSFQCVVFLFTKEFNIKESTIIAYNATISKKAQWKIYLPKNNSKFLISEMYLSDSEISMVKFETEAQ